MAEYIDKSDTETVFREVRKRLSAKKKDYVAIEFLIKYQMLSVAEEVIHAIPAADVRPVVRGHWIGTKEAEDMGDIMKEFTCSACGCCEWDCTESESFNFCPNCGADMRGDDDG